MQFVNEKFEIDLEERKKTISNLIKKKSNKYYKIIPKSLCEKKIAQKNEVFFFQ